MLSGRIFREIFLEFRGGFLHPFSMEKFGKRRGRRGWKWGRGEEKIKSAYGKNEFCDHKQRAGKLHKQRTFRLLMWGVIPF